MDQVTTIGLDLAKNTFQAHGADASGTPVLRKKLRRDQVLSFFAAQPPCTVAMEACPGAHYWGREIGKLGHAVRLIAPQYVKPFVKRQKNDSADAEAICEAASRPTMRFVPVKSEEKQASIIVFRSRDLLVGQRTQIINALRGHLSEYGFVVRQGPAYITQLVAHLQEPNNNLPEATRTILTALVAMLRTLEEHIETFDKEIISRAKRSDLSRRLMSIPGVGAITATATEAIAPSAENFRRGRDFAAWLGIPPSEHSTGGKQRLGKMSKKGDATLRRLLIIGASSVVRQAVRKGARPGSWLARMLARKPRMLVIVALANKMARIVWALMAHGGTYRTPAVAA